jgi:hypothetical protein
MCVFESNGLDEMNILIPGIWTLLTSSFPKRIFLQVGSGTTCPTETNGPNYFVTSHFASPHESAL